MWRRLLGGSFLPILLAAAVAGCGASSSGGTSAKATLVYGVYQPFTGPDATFGPQGMALCWAAANGINQSGGVLGHKFTCKPFDSTSDPADALPVANRMIASTGNLVAIYGPVDVEVAVEPLLNNAKLVHFSDQSDPRYDHQTSPWFFRAAASDSLAGIALGVYAQTHGYTHAASVFTNDPSAQTSVPSLTSSYPRIGGSFAVKLTLAPGQTSYRTEVARVLAAHPDAVISEMDPQTAATFLSEMLQLNNGKLLPYITTSRTESSDWITAVLHAIGKANYEHYITPVFAKLSETGTGYSHYYRYFMTAPQAVPSRSQFVTDVYNQWGYDELTVAALAMQEAKSTDQSKWAPLVVQIADGTPGAVVVHSFGEGKQALASGKKIRFVGATGSLFFNSNHNNITPFAGYHYNGQGTGNQSLVPTAGIITQAQIQHAQQ